MKQTHQISLNNHLEIKLQTCYNALSTVTLLQDKHAKLFYYITVTFTF